MKVIIVDGQGGRIGQMLVEGLKSVLPNQELMVIGTNSIATSSMLKAGADLGATGENPVVYNAYNADIIAGPLGIVIANALLGEVTPKMAKALGESKAHKVLIPVDRCNNTVVGVEELPFSQYIHLAVLEVERFIRGE